MKAAARRRVCEVGRRPGDRREHVANVVDIGHRAQEAQGVGVSRLPKHRLDGAGLDDLARIHHGDPLARLGDLGIAQATGVVSVCLDSPYLTLAVTAALARLRIASSPFNDPGAAIPRPLERRPQPRTGVRNTRPGASAGGRTR